MALHPVRITPSIFVQPIIIRKSTILKGSNTYRKLTTDHNVDGRTTTTYHGETYRSV